MTSATEQGQEKTGCPAGTATSPLVPQTGLHRRALGHRLVIALVCLISALIAVVGYANRGRNEARDPGVQPGPRVASVTPEPAKTRSFTRNVTATARPPLAEAAAAQPTAGRTREHVTLSDPVTTGAISVRAAEEAPSKAVAVGTASTRPTLQKGRLPSGVRVAQLRGRATALRRQHMAYRPGFRRLVAADCFLFCF
jgi:hypothetical protein